MMEICNLLGVKKINTTAYHPQTNGLTERFNRMLTDMLAKRVEKNGRDWDTYLPFVLFAYRASMQKSMGHHFISFMVKTPDCQLYWKWT